MKEDNKNKVEEPAVAYQPTSKKTITFFNNFEEMEEHGLKIMALQSYEQRLTNLELLRKQMFHQLLLPNKQYPSIKRVITKTILPYAVCQ